MERDKTSNRKILFDTTLDVLQKNQFNSLVKILSSASIYNAWVIKMVKCYNVPHTGILNEILR